jgi:hypothetical protein
MLFVLRVQFLCRIIHLERSGCFNRANTLESSRASDFHRDRVAPFHEASPTWRKSDVCSHIMINHMSYPSMRISCQSICQGRAPRPWSRAAQVAASFLSIHAQHLRARPLHWATLMYPSRRMRRGESRPHLLCWRAGCWRMMRRGRT